MGIESKVRYEARLRCQTTGGSVSVTEDELKVRDADAVTILIAAATNFVNYKDLSADPVVRAESALTKASAKKFESIETAHVQEHQRLFRRVKFSLQATANAQLPTDER